MQKKRGKFGAVRTNGYASKAEAARANELHGLERMGVIRDLEEQVNFVISPVGCNRIVYRTDFCYYDCTGAVSGSTRMVAEDVKGVETPVFKLKAKLFIWKFHDTYTLFISHLHKKRGMIYFTMSNMEDRYGNY